MLTIAICDDDAEYLQKIHAALDDFIFRQSLLHVLIKDFSDSVEFVDYIKANPCPEIVLLDICMPLVSGIEVAQIIRTKSAETKIIFLTISPEYAVEAFSVNASHYLVKPFTQAQFDEAMSRIAQVFKNEPQQIAINEKGESVTLVDISEISYIESIGYHRYVHTPKGELTETRRTLAQFLVELEAMSEGQFIAPYRGYTVNLAAVRTITPKAIQMKDGANILIKPGDFRRLKENFFHYTFERGGLRLLN